MADVIIGGAIFLYSAFLIVRMMKNRKNPGTGCCGCTGCSGHCGSCSGSCLQKGAEKSDG